MGEITFQEINESFRLPLNYTFWDAALDVKINLLIYSQPKKAISIIFAHVPSKKLRTEASGTVEVSTATQYEKGLSTSPMVSEEKEDFVVP